jgi:hypothetical protein
LVNRLGAPNDWTDESGFTTNSLFGIWSADMTGIAWAVGAGGQIWRRN